MGFRLARNHAAVGFKVLVASRDKSKAVDAATKVLPTFSYYLFLLIKHAD